MTRSIVYSPRAREQLTDLYHWIAERSGCAERAERFVSAVLDHCEDLRTFPMMGLARDDLRPGLRTISFRRHVVIAFAVQEETVEIHGIYYGGQDYVTLITSEGD